MVTYIFPEVFLAEKGFEHAFLLCPGCASQNAYQSSLAALRQTDFLVISTRQLGWEWGVMASLAECLFHRQKTNWVNYLNSLCHATLGKL